MFCFFFYKKEGNSTFRFHGTLWRAWFACVCIGCWVHYTLFEGVCEVSHWMLWLPSGTPVATTASVKFLRKLNTTAWPIYFANPAHENTLTVQESGLNAEAIIFSCGLQHFSVATFGWLFLHSLLAGETWTAELCLVFQLQILLPCPLLVNSSAPSLIFTVPVETYLLFTLFHFQPHSSAGLQTWHLPLKQIFLYCFVVTADKTDSQLSKEKKKKSGWKRATEDYLFFQM